jgi:hypothetical protein
VAITRRVPQLPWLQDMAVAVTSLMGAVVLLLVSDDGTLGLLGLPLVLFVPGYVLATAFGGRQLASRELGGTEMVMLAFALSLGLDVLLATGLAVTPIGLSTRTFAGALLVLMLVLAVARAVSSPSGKDLWRSGIVVVGRDVAVGVAAVVLVIAAFAIAMNAARDAEAPQLLQLYLEPVEQPAGPLIVAATNQGLGTLDCQASIPASADGSVAAMSWPSFTLGDGMLWRGALPASASDTRAPVDLTLSCAAPDFLPITRSLRLVDGT